MEKKRDNPSPATYTQARSEIEHLVERFARNLEAYKRTEYKEAHVRVEFIDPFFEALGWDVRNVRGYAEQYKDVIHEETIKVGGATRAPDYCCVSLVERMLALHHEHAAATVPPDKEFYQRQIEVTDRQIDALVYELYGLTGEEIKIVEDATG